MGKTCCCEPGCECIGVSNNVENMRLQIGGLHSHDILKSARNLRNSTIFDNQCLKDSCSTPTIDIGIAGPVSFPTSLRKPDCCAAFGWVTDTTEGTSTAVANSRDWQFTITKTESGTTDNLCDPGGPDLPWQKNSDYLLKGYVWIIAKRVIDSVKLKFCPTVGPEDELLWTVTADVCWRVAYATRENGEAIATVDAWRHNTIYNIFTSVCIDPVVKKYCAVSCSYDVGTGTPPITTGTGHALDYDCLTTFEYHCYDPTPLTTLGQPCSNTTTPSCDSRALDTVRVVNVAQRRIITIPRTCELPAVLEFPLSALSGANDDVSVGWTRLLVPFCDYEFGTKVETGDHSDFTVYSAMTETWTISLA